MQDLIGQTVDRYQVAVLLGKEHWGATWKAYDPKFDRTVTFMTLDPVWAAQQDMGDYVLTTARAVLRFRHPGIARLLDIGQAELRRSDSEAPGRFSVDFLVQEFIPGGSLAALLEDIRRLQKRVPLQEAIELTAEVARALDYAHRRNIIHGSLNPSLILLKDEPTGELPYRPVLVQLGFTNLEVPDTAPESPYRAPEVARGAPAQAGADIYSLGAVLYELLTLRTPEDHPLPRPAELRPQVPAALEDALRKALSPDPGLRFSDAAQMAGALDSLLAGLRRSSAATATGVTLRLEDEESLESLHAALRRSRGDPALAEMLPEPVTTPLPLGLGDLGRDQVHILEPGQSPRSQSLRPGALIIGRGQNADLRIDQPGISRHHARLEFESGQWRVTDLHSTNGTYLEDQLLSPGVPTPWTPGENLRVGEVWLRLERGSMAAVTRPASGEVTRPARNLPETVPVVTSTTGQSIDPGEIVLSSRGLVGAHIDNPNLTVAPGSGETVKLTLFNRGPRSDTFYIACEGDACQWLTAPPQTVTLTAGSDREISLTLHPPRSPAARAGRHQIILRITSQNARDQVVELRLAATLSAFSEYSSELQVDRLRSGQVGRVLIHNRGNLPETFSVVWEDRLHEVVFDPPQLKATVPAGKTASIEFRPSLLQPRYFGSDTSHSFKVHVSAQTGQMQTHSGEYVGRALVPPWAPVAASALCVILACVMLLVVNQATEPARAERATQQANRTAVAMVTRQALDATQTAVAVENLLAATRQAATATAGWAGLDSDGDGLANNLEIVAGTRLDHPDTDGDRLTDGEEVHRYKTNPLLPDTDGDLLQDGDEIVRGTDPLRRDTDGDGLDDGFDPNPLTRPTSTTIFIPTFTQRPPTHTPTFTPTPTQAITTADFGISISNNRGASIPGQNVSYTIQVANRGPGAAGNVAVTAALPPTLASPVWTCAPSPGAQCLNPTGTGNINARVNLPPNTIVVFTLDAIIAPNATGQLVLTTTVGAPAGVTDPNAFDNQATDVDTLTPRVSLTLTKTDNRTSINAGQTIAYTIRVVNNGPSAVTGVSLIDAFPPEIINSSWTCVPTPGSSCSVGGFVPGNVNTLLNLIPGGSATVTTSGTVRPDAVGTLTNSASITSPIDPLENNRTVSDTTTIVGASDLGLTVTTPPTVTATLPLTYTLAILNAGPSPAANLELEFQIPPDAALITVTLTTPGVAPVCNAATGRTVCNLGSLPTGATTQLNVQVQAPPAPGVLGVVWQVRSSQTDTSPANNVATTSVTVVALPPPYPEPSPDGIGP